MAVCTVFNSALQIDSKQLIMPLTEFVVYLCINLPDDDLVEVETRGT